MIDKIVMNDGQSDILRTYSICLKTLCKFIDANHIGARGGSSNFIVTLLLLASCDCVPTQ